MIRWNLRSLKSVLLPARTSCLTWTFDDSNFGDFHDRGTSDAGDKIGYHIKLLGSLKPAEAVPDELDSRKAAAERLMQAAEQKALLFA